MSDSQKASTVSRVLERLNSSSTHNTHDSQFIAHYYDGYGPDPEIIAYVYDAADPMVTFRTTVSLSELEYIVNNLKTTKSLINTLGGESNAF